MPERVEAPSAVASAAAGSAWRLEVLRGSAAELHAEPVEPVRCVRVNEVTGTSLVLGSAQAPPDGDLPEGVEMVRRRSGGGAVWLAEGTQVWLDVVIGREDPLWVDDVGRSAGWLGAAWAEVLGGRSGGAEVWAGPMQHRELGALACFAGVGPGEVLVGGRKVVGISQRRTRSLARFQSVAYLRWSPAALIEVLGDPLELSGRLRGAAGPLSAGGDRWDVVERLLLALP